MNLSNYFWYFSGVLTPKFCDEVIKYALSKEESMARTGGFDKKKEGDPTNGKVRKLSMTCQLTDGSEYTGGELEFDFRNYDPHLRDESKHVRSVPEILPKGSIVVFPSHLWHRVKPVTRGTRYSLVVWHLGYPFK